MRRSIVLRGRRVDYELERKRVRHVNLRIRADGSLYVSAPRLTPLPVVEGLLLSRQDWVLEHLRRREERAAEESDAVWLWGEKLKLALRQGKRAAVAREGGTLILTLRDPSDAEEKRRVLENWQKRLCAERVTELCRRYYPAFERRGVPFPTLSFNTRLAELPPDAADYVVVHEFAHFLQPNHSAAFYAEIARVLPDWQERRAMIRAWEKRRPL